jgi:hypothetical protein
MDKYELINSISEKVDKMINTHGVSPDTIFSAFEKMESLIYTGISVKETYDEKIQDLKNTKDVIGEFLSDVADAAKKRFGS